ncbi:MAG: PAS domain S-box protein [Planctomycetota bacterium]|nr:MAG: PAS domain S-box protein [Planctomycetota bacterium]
MWDFITNLFDTSDFPNRWNCGNWSAGHGYLHIVSDLATFAAYTAIPCVLAYFVIRRRDLPFPRIFWLFCVFVFACGTVHLIEATIFWWPWYRLSGVAKATTALASLVTVVALIPIVPRALRMRTPEQFEYEIDLRTRALQQANQQLEAEISKRHEVESELRSRMESLDDAEKRLRAVVNNVLDGIITINEGGIVQSYNQAAESIFEYSEDEVIGKNVKMLMPEPFHGSHDKYLTNYVTSHEPKIIGIGREVVGLRKNGAEFPMDLAVSEYSWEGQRCFIGIVRDISDRKRAEEVTTRLAAIVESSDDAIIGKTLEGTITNWNRGATHLYGYTAEEMIGKSILTLVPSERKEEVLRIHEQLRRGERVKNIETVRRRKDGRLIDISLTISPILVGNDEIIGAAAIARDITERKRAEKSARFLAHASAALATVDDERSTLRKVARLALPEFADACAVEIVDARKQWVRLANSTDPNGSESTRRSAAARLPAADALPEVHETIQSRRVILTLDTAQHATSQTDQSFELRQRSLSEYGLGSILCVPLLRRNRCQGVLEFGSAADKPCFTAADVRVAQELAERVVVALENVRLYDRLREADRRKDEFLAMLAHELRNPLAPIRSGLELLDMPSIDDDTAVWARATMREQVSHMVRLIDDLLDVSRIVRGKISLHREDVELSSIIGRALDEVRPQLRDKNHQLDVELPERTVWLNADPVRLAQVFSNLLDNAAKYTETDGNVWLSAEVNGNAVIVRIRDNGTGIAPEDVGGIFDIFTQAHTSIARTPGGLGIGLTLVKRLVELHGGRVSVASKGLGEGTEFTIELPILEEPPGDPSSTQSAADNDLRIPPPRRVLVVDDNESAARSLGLLLRSWGHDIQIAFDATEALKLANEHAPDVVFLDIGMPDISGYELARQLRDASRTKSALLVALTGYGQEADRHRSSEAGFDMHLVKPAGESDLQNVFRHSKLAHPRQRDSD